MFVGLWKVSAAENLDNTWSETCMICDMQIAKPARHTLSPDLIGIRSIVDGDIHVECFGEGRELHVIAVSTSLSHSAQVSLKGGIDLGGRRCLGVDLG